MICSINTWQKYSQVAEKRKKLVPIIVPSKYAFFLGNKRLRVRASVEVGVFKLLQITITEKRREENIRIYVILPSEETNIFFVSGPQNGLQFFYLLMPQTSKQ